MKTIFWPPFWGITKTCYLFGMVELYSGYGVLSAFWADADTNLTKLMSKCDKSIDFII